MIFKTYSEFEVYYFPKQYAKKQKERRIKEIGLERYIAEQLFEILKEIFTEEGLFVLFVIEK